MTIQSPIVLASGFFSQLFPGDTVPGTDTTAQASGNTALVLANTALASGNAAVVLASTALASGNAGLVSASNKVPISGGTMTGVLAVTSGTDALPGITFTGDPNTGFWSPTADTIAASTGGAERIRVDSSGNLKFNSGYGSVATAYGCRAWVNFDGTGTVAIRGSGNVSSITDNGTGAYQLNFTTALADANFVVAGTATPADEASVGLGTRWITLGSAMNGNIGRSASMVKVTVSYSSGDPYADGKQVNVAVFR